VSTIAGTPVARLWSLLPATASVVVVLKVAGSELTPPQFLNGLSAVVNMPWAWPRAAWPCRSATADEILAKVQLVQTNIKKLVNAK
jgi:hypothetical protein